MRIPPSDHTKKGLLPIVEIIQGPLIDPQLGLKSLDMLLTKYGYDQVKIRKSDVPIRRIKAELVIENDTDRERFEFLDSIINPDQQLF